MTEKDTLRAVVEIELRLRHIKTLIEDIRVTILAKSTSLAHSLLHREDIASHNAQIDELKGEYKLLVEQHYEKLLPFTTKNEYNSNYEHHAVTMRVIAMDRKALKGAK